MASAMLGLTGMLIATSSTAQGAGAQRVANITVETHEGYMKTLMSTNTALGMKIMSNDLAGAAKDAQQIATIFGDIEKFWAQNRKQDGVMWAQQGRQAATDMAGALGAGDTTKAQAARKQMQGSCASCHMAYREGSPQTGYTLKAGVVVTP
ncbi:MAG TPA: hypothetical protein VFV95_03145 [Vicinamibacterales bacterium]|nr:hypothetical protein [Vicinamibacterales bacterium]